MIDFSMTVRLLAQSRKKADRRPGARCVNVHVWMALLGVRGFRARKPSRWKCPVCRRCQYLTWHREKRVDKPCPKCGQDPCAARKCAHELCRWCTIGHGFVRVTNGECDACREWAGNHPNMKPFDPREDDTAA